MTGTKTVNYIHQFKISLFIINIVYCKPKANYILSKYPVISELAIVLLFNPTTPTLFHSVLDHLSQVL